MQSEEATDRSKNRKTWLIVFVVSLFVFATFWSVDSFVFWILLGFSAFSLFKVLQNREKRATGGRFENSYEQAYNTRPSFWDELKHKFTSPTPRHRQNPANQSRLVSIVVLIFVGLIILSVIIPQIFSDSSEVDAAQAQERANDFYNQQAYDSASYYYGKAIRNDSENSSLYLLRGNAFLNSNQSDSAMADYDRAIELKPEYKEAFYNKGLIYYNRKQYYPAIKEFKNAVAIDQAYADAKLMIGDSFYNSSQLDSAIIWYEEAYENGYRSAALSHIMAYVYDVKGNPQKAIPFYKEAISYDTTRTEIYSRLGELISGEEGSWYRQKAAQYPRL